MPNASNVNFTVDETVPNLVMVPSRGGIALYNSSAGTAELVVDMYGFFS
jgi:hypothetical protein